MKTSPFLKKLVRPDVLLLLLAAFFYIRHGLSSMSVNPGWDVHYGDTYLVFTWPWWLAPGAIVLLLFALIYRLTRNYRQWKAIQYVHVLSYLVVPGLTYLMSVEFQVPYYRNRIAMGTVSTDYIHWLTLLLVCIFLLGQLAFLVNLVAGFIRGKKSVPVLQ